jgi:hypothetical protein
VEGRAEDGKVLSAVAAGSLGVARVEVCGLGWRAKDRSAVVWAGQGQSSSDVGGPRTDQQWCGRARDRAAVVWAGGLSVGDMSCRHFTAPPCPPALPPCPQRLSLTMTIKLHW